MANPIIKVESGVAFQATIEIRGIASLAVRGTCNEGLNDPRCLQLEAILWRDAACGVAGVAFVHKFGGQSEANHAHAVVCVKTGESWLAL